MFVYNFSNGNATAAVEEYRERFSSRRIMEKDVNIKLSAQSVKLLDFPVHTPQMNVRVDKM